MVIRRRTRIMCCLDMLLACSEPIKPNHLLNEVWMPWNQYRRYRDILLERRWMRSIKVDGEPHFIITRKGMKARDIMKETDIRDLWSRVP